MAAIGWNLKSGIAFKCGGSLISEKFVLTVAHCRKKDESEKVLPSIVRLGDHNIASYRQKSKFVDYVIKEFITHEKYRPSSKINDIALIELTEDVQFTKYIRPACLQQNNLLRNKTVVAVSR